MSVLEDRYRSILRILPASYRDSWEDDMVATFLESVRTGDPDEDEFVADYGRPPWSEVASVVALALRLRLGGTEAPPRAFAWGEAVRLVALVGLMVNAVTATVGGGVMLWVAGQLPWLPSPPEGTGLAVWHLAGLLWIPAFAALLFHHRQAAQLLALGALVPAAAVSAVELAGGAAPFTVATWFALLTEVLLVLALGAFHRDAPPAPRRPWLIAYAVGVAVMPPVVFLAQPIGGQLLLDWAGICSIAAVVAAVAYLAMPGRRSPAWSLALALVAAIVLAQRILTLLDYRMFADGPERSTLTVLGVVETVAVLAATAVLAALAARTMRELPDGSADAGTRASPPGENALPVRPVKTPGRGGSA